MRMIGIKFRNQHSISIVSKVMLTEHTGSIFGWLQGGSGRRRLMRQLLTSIIAPLVKLLSSWKGFRLTLNWLITQKARRAQGCSGFGSCYRTECELQPHMTPQMLLWSIKLQLCDGNELWPGKMINNISCLRGSNTWSWELFMVNVSISEWMNCRSPNRLAVEVQQCGKCISRKHLLQFSSAGQLDSF